MRSTSRGHTTAHGADDTLLAALSTGSSFTFTNDKPNYCRDHQSRNVAVVMKAQLMMIRTIRCLVGQGFVCPALAQQARMVLV